MTKPTTFLAHFPEIQSAIQIHGRGDGMRIQLEIPENQMGNAADLLLWRRMVLKVTVVPDDPDPKSSKTRRDAWDEM